jgi:hypothetical protein
MKERKIPFPLQSRRQHQSAKLKNEFFTFANDIPYKTLINQCRKREVACYMARLNN